MRAAWRLPMRSTGSQTPRPRSILHEVQGDAAVEYLFLVGTIALPAIVAFVAVGRAIVNSYTTMQNILILPLP